MKRKVIQKCLDITGLTVAYNIKMIACFLQSFHSLTQARIKFSTVFTQIIIFHGTTGHKQVFPLFSLGKRKEHLSDLIHGPSHGAVHILFCHDDIRIAALVQSQCPGRCHLFGRIPECSIHIKYNSLFHLFSSFTAFLYTHKYNLQWLYCPRHWGGSHPAAIRCGLWSTDKDQYSRRPSALPCPR